MNTPEDRDDDNVRHPDTHCYAQLYTNALRCACMRACVRLCWLGTFLHNNIQMSRSAIYFIVKHFWSVCTSAVILKAIFGEFGESVELHFILATKCVLLPFSFAAILRRIFFVVLQI